MANDSLMVSSGNDRWVFFWRGVKIWCKQQFKSVVEGVVECRTSGQWIINERNGTVSVLDGKAIRSGRIEVSRVIQNIEVERVRDVQEIDDSFVELIGEEGI